MKTMQKLYENKKLKIDDLSVVKLELKNKIDTQEHHISSSVKRLVPFTKDSTTINLNSKSLSPLTLITTPFRKGKTLTVIDGLVIGYKVMRNVRRFFFRK